MCLLGDIYLPLTCIYTGFKEQAVFNNVKLCKTENKQQSDSAQNNFTADSFRFKLNKSVCWPIIGWPSR